MRESKTIGRIVIAMLLLLTLTSTIVWASTSYPLDVTAGASTSLDPNPLAVGDEAIATLTATADKPTQNVEGQLTGPTWSWSVQSVEVTATANGQYAAADGSSYSAGITQPDPKSPSAVLKFTPKAAGYWRLTLNASCSYTDGDNNTWSGSKTTQLGAIAYTVTSLKVRPSGTTDWKETDITIAAGAVASAAHQADVLLEITPKVAGKVKVSLGGGQGHTSAKGAKLSFGSTTIAAGATGEVTTGANGQATGTLTSSDVLNNATATAGSYSRKVGFAGDNYDEEDAWISDPYELIPGGSSNETVTFALNGVPLDGHVIRFYVEEVQWVDDNGEVKTATNTADNACDLSEWATFEAPPDPTNPNGVVTAKLNMKDRPEMILLVMRAYDMTVWAAQ